MEEVEQIYTAEDSGSTVRVSHIKLYLILMIVFIMICTVVYLSNSNSVSKPIERIIFSGLSALNESEIIKELDDKSVSYTGLSPDLSQMKICIEKNPFVESAYIFRKNSSELEIEIKERVPASILINDNGDISFMSNDGWLLPYRVKCKFSNLLVIRGFLNDGKVDKTAFKSAYELISNLKTGLYDKLYSGISEIIFNHVDKTFSLILSGYKASVLLGNAKDIDAKLRLLNVFWQNKISDIDMEKTEYLDVRWKDRIVLKNKIYPVQMQTVNNLN